MIKNSMIILSAIFAFSCSAQNITNNQVTLKTGDIGKILYRSSIISETGIDNTKTYMYDNGTSKLFKETSNTIKEDGHKWSYDGSKILAYRSDYNRVEGGVKSSVVIYDTAGNEIDNIVEIPEPEVTGLSTDFGGFTWFHKSNNILFVANNMVRSNEYEIVNYDLIINNYDSVPKSSKKINDKESFAGHNNWPALSLDDSMVLSEDYTGSKTSIYTFNINNKEKKLIYEFDGNVIVSLGWHPLYESTVIATIGSETYFIDINSKEKTQIFSKDNSSAYSMKFSPDSKEFFLYTLEGTTLVNTETKEEKKYSGKLDWTCDKDTFLLSKKEGFYTTDRNMNKKELIIKSEGDPPNVEISDINCL